MEPDSPSSEDQIARRPLWKRILWVVGWLLLGIVFLGMTVWSVLAIYYSNLPAWLRPVVAVMFAAGAVWALVFTRPRWRGRVVFLAAFAVLVMLWLAIPPSNDRDWQPDVAVLPDAVIEGNKITIRNIRNCDYPSETDYDVHHYDRTYDLDKLRSADLFLIYWGSPMIAHTMVSFGFESGDYLCVSIETRKEKGEDYSAIRGFFKQYELIYVFADERDVVRLRTNYRGEEVYLYRLKMTPNAMRDMLVGYLREAHRLNLKPEWYNAMTDNCTTNIRGHARPYMRTPWDWRILLNGYLDEMIYRNGRMDQSMPFAEMKSCCHINEKAQSADKDPAFSKRIREGLPGITQ